jgi:hypothetical protein
LYSFITKVDFNVCIRFLLKLISMFVFFHQSKVDFRVATAVVNVLSVP